MEKLISPKRDGNCTLRGMQCDVGVSELVPQKVLMGFSPSVTFLSPEALSYKAVFC